MNFLTQSNKGFSLLEVLIAVAIFAICILAINSLQVRNIKSGSDSKNMTEAANFANAKLEELIALPYDNLLDVDEDGSGNLDDIGQDADGTAVMGGYEVSWNIAEDAIISGTKTIKVIALFKFNEDAKNGQLTRVALQTIISK